MVSYLVILRISPLPPHWMVNIVCPHLSISVPLFWISTFIGVMAVSFIHCQIGTTLDQMSSAKDFNLLSWRNFFGLAGVMVGAMLPVAIRRYYGGELKTLAEAGHDSGQLDDTLAAADSGYAAGDHVVVDVPKDQSRIDEPHDEGKDQTYSVMKLPPDRADPARGGTIRL